ncbi:argininosuccinate synthase [Kangiella sediminilitoris]|uniref:argininosuccinate synthase n=1 Tax=Kangiella sediminilitoris TaxID=1144748 RepID=A0A1B3BCS5_9GAMM|nr:argininosuccinate synthase [Kangiella sediminilitoris]AOE50609.1 argininosuccinate synthase [Kangiella sediminilitoris]
MSKEKVVLAFSGGLDTSFCVPYLIDKGYEVHTLFVNTGGVSEQAVKDIESTAIQLGAKKHWNINGQEQLWNTIVKPLIWGSALYQDQYPVLCADRYLIAEEAVKLCHQLGTSYVAHGCTGMGNDQVRFDLSIKALSDLTILSPIRDIQKEVVNVREYEIDYLSKHGHEVSVVHKEYSVNENLLGVTISGGAIDKWQAPEDNTYVLTQNPESNTLKPQLISLTFEQGVLSQLNGKDIDGVSALQEMNSILGEYGVGRGIYTGDTIIGLKGRIVFEAPALMGLLKAHRALEEVVLTQQQNHFKPLVAKKWVDLVYQGFYFDPLTKNLEALLESSQKKVTGTVELKLAPNHIEAVAVSSPYLLMSKNVEYAQKADWGIEEASGFIKLFGQSTATWATVNASQDSAV